MKVRDLKNGDQFKIGKQRNFRTFNKSFDLNKMQNPREEDKGKLLIIYDGCRQMVIEPETELSAYITEDKFVPKSPKKSQLKDGVLFLMNTLESKSILITPIDLQESMFFFQKIKSIPLEFIRVWLRNELGVSPEETTHYHRLNFDNGIVEIEKKVSRGRPYLIKREVIENYSVE